MPRRNRPAGDGRHGPERRRGSPRREPSTIDEIAERVRGPVQSAREGFVVKRSQGDKAYTCPFCNGEIRSGESHIVAFPEGQLGDRRHYHAGCWTKFNRR